MSLTEELLAEDRLDRDPELMEPEEIEDLWPQPTAASSELLGRLNTERLREGQAAHPTRRGGGMEGG